MKPFVCLELMLVQMQIQFLIFFLKEINIRSSCCYNEEDFKEVMELMAKGMSPEYTSSKTKANFY